MTEEFIRAIQSKNKVRLTFFSKEDAGILVRICAPMDYGSSRRTFEKNDRYHFWDYDSDIKRHTLSLSPEQIESIEVLSEKFNPAEFITWDIQKSPWLVSRDWGVYS